MILALLLRKFRFFEGEAMKKIIFPVLLGVTILLSACGDVSEKLGTGTYTDDGVNVSVLSYDMELKLDTENDRLNEAVRMELKNNGDSNVDTVYLRYYPNGYVPFLKGSFPDENKGKKLSSEITSVAIAGTGRNLPLAYDWDGTLVKVSLDGEGIPVGGTIELEVNAWTNIPAGNSRFGLATWDEGKMYHLTFCFPYLEYNKDGWYLDPPRYSILENRNPMTADYHVTVEAPNEYLIAGPGEITRNGEKTTIEAQGLRNLALFASNCMGVDEFELDEVKISNYYLKTEGEKEYREYSKQFLTDAFEHLTEMVGPYDRSEFSLIEGTRNMEYSGISEVSGRGFYDYDPSRFDGVYENTLHEVAHQWFFGGVGNYEYREGWIDESFTQFLEEEIMCKDTKSAEMIKEKYKEAEIGKAYYDKRASKRAELKQDIDQIDHFPLNNIDQNPLKTYRGSKVNGEMNPGYREYDYGPLFLSQAEDIMGEDKFYSFVKDVYNTYGLKVAETQGILEILKKHNNSKEMNDLISFYFDVIP